jgi:hypothetical protein
MRLCLLSVDRHSPRSDDSAQPEEPAKFPVALRKVFGVIVRDRSPSLWTLIRRDDVANTDKLWPKMARPAGVVPVASLRGAACLNTVVAQANSEGVGAPR